MSLVASSPRLFCQVDSERCHVCQSQGRTRRQETTVCPRGSASRPRVRVVGVKRTGSEYATFYAGYIQLAAVRGSVLTALPKQIDDIRSALGDLTDKQALFRDAPQEWSIKEVMGHLNDVERVFSYRLLRISRNDATPLPGFEQNDYVREAGCDNCLLEDLIGEFEHLRRANILAIQNMNEDALLYRGTASGYPVSARALIHMLVGHVDHHMASLHEKYLPGASAL